MRRFQWLCVAAVFIACGAMLATTWFSADIECPLCHTKNSFDEVASYGSYIYRWPSKFQIVYWPRTAGNVLYTCKRCNYSAFMWDFKNPPADKLEAIRHALTNLTVESHARYTDIPMSVRLEIAEKVYAVLNKDDEFWCDFYRTKGYHLAREKRTADASHARARALEIAHRMLNDPANASRRKELFLISGAMQHFLDNDLAAKADLESSLKAHYEDATLTPEEMKNVNDNMNGLATEYLGLLATHKVPKDDGSDDNKSIK